ncbi:hypothetical protein BJX70DRAFT_380444 [Aspergillus crustosus]
MAGSRLLCLFCAFSTGLAQSFTILDPLDGEGHGVSNLWVHWIYGSAFDGRTPITVGVGRLDEYSTFSAVFQTTTPASGRGAYLDPTNFPSISTVDLFVMHELEGGIRQIDAVITDITLVGTALATTTTTVTRTATTIESTYSTEATTEATTPDLTLPEPTSEAFETSEMSETSEAAEPESITSGLSTGAKVGIGIGIAAGLILLITFGGILLLRRRRARTQIEEPKTIREITQSSPSSLTLGGLSRSSLHVMEQTRPVISRTSMSGREDRDRFALG